MLNFTVGPVQSSESVRRIGSENVPYFRTTEFSEVMFENERLIKEFSYASDDSRVVFITGSGTASMEAVIMNTFSSKDKVIVINGGSFGQRFVDICSIHDIPYTEIKLDLGKGITEEQLAEYEGKGYTGLVVNIHETSTGVRYDLDMLGEYCKRNNLFFVVDAISSFIADPVDMQKNLIDVMITGSQKALACPPGISIIVMSPAAIKRVEENNVKSMYFNLKSALLNGERGQTPFTPAVGILLQINQRLIDIKKGGGILVEQNRIAKLALDFRSRIKGLPLDICSNSLSNAVTPLKTHNCSAYDIFTILKDEYCIWICPNGGALKEIVFRVGHIGELTIEDNSILSNALHDLAQKGILK